MSLMPAIYDQSRKATYWSRPYAVTPSFLKRTRPHAKPNWVILTSGPRDINLRLNPDKILEIILYVRGRRGIQAEAQPSPTVQNIERANSIKALGIIISSQLSMTEHESTVLKSCARSIYGLRLLRAHGMSDDCLQEVFCSTVHGQAGIYKPSLVGFLLRKQRQQTRPISQQMQTSQILQSDHTLHHWTIWQSWSISLRNRSNGPSSCSVPLLAF